MIQIFGTAKCKGTKAAERFFAERGIKVQRIDLKQKGIAKGELQSVAKSVGGVAQLLDKESARARDKGLHVLSVDAERLTAMLVDDAQLLRTPIVRCGSKAVVGTAEDAWKAFADVEKSAT